MVSSGYITTIKAGGHTRDAGVGAGGVPPVDALAPPHVQVRAANKDIPAQQNCPIKVPYTNIFSVETKCPLRSIDFIYFFLF